MFLTPRIQSLFRVPVAVLLGVLRNHHALYLDGVGFELFGQAIPGGLFGNAVVADERVGENQDLSLVGGVGHGLGIPDHSGREYHLAGRGFPVAEGPAFEHRTVFELELNAVFNLHTLLFRTRLRPSAFGQNRALLG